MKKRYQISNIKYQKLLKQKIRKRETKNLLSFIFYLLSENSGQIVLILVLITIVGLTIGLSLISRTITDIRISYQIEESSRAFSAAEAAVETALRGSSIGETKDLTLSGADASYKVEKLGGTTSVYTLALTEAKKVRTIWLAEHNNDETLNLSATYPVGSSIEVCWGSESDNNAAMVMTLLYKDIDDQYKVVKAAYDPEPSAEGHNINNFLTTVDKGDLGTYCDSFRFRKTINETSAFWDGFTLDANAKLIALRLQPVYQATAIGVKPTTDTPLPSQGKQIISVGKTETGIVRRIQVAQEFPTLPELFNYTFFSEN